MVVLALHTEQNRIISQLQKELTRDLFSKTSLICQLQPLYAVLYENDEAIELKDFSSQITGIKLKELTLTSSRNSSFVITMPLTVELTQNKTIQTKIDLCLLKEKERDNLQNVKLPPLPFSELKIFRICKASKPTANSINLDSFVWKKLS